MAETNHPTTYASKRYQAVAAAHPTWSSSRVWATVNNMLNREAARKRLKQAQAASRA